jgi:hypothetical protein
MIAERGADLIRGHLAGASTAAAPA